MEISWNFVSPKKWEPCSVSPPCFDMSQSISIVDWLSMIILTIEIVHINLNRFLSCEDIAFILLNVSTFCCFFVTEYCCH